MEITSKQFRPLLLAICGLTGAVAISSSAHAALLPISASWSGASQGNGVTASLSALVDTAGFSHQLGPVVGFNGVTYANAWWFAPGSGFTGLSLTVSGSTNSSANATFGQADVNWVRIFSNSASPDLALFDPASISDIESGNPLGPTDNGLPGRIVTPTGGGGGNENIVSQGVFTTVPEPGSLALVALGGFGFLARRRFARKS